MSRSAEVDRITAYYAITTNVPLGRTIVVRQEEDKWRCYVAVGDVASIEGYRVEAFPVSSEEQKRKQEG